MSPGTNQNAANVNIFRYVFRTLSNIYDGTFAKKCNSWKSITNFAQKLHHRCLTGSSIHFWIIIWNWTKMKSVRKKCLYSELSCFVFFRIRTEYGEIRTLFKQCFSLKVSTMNMTKSVGNCGFGHIYWKNT